MVVTTRARARRLRTVAILVIAIATTGATHRAMDVKAKALSRGIVVPGPEFARLIAFGFDAALADYYWMRAVQLAGTQESGVELDDLARLLEAVVALNPWVDHPYRFAAVWLNTSPEIVERSNHLLERGIAYHPLDWRNRYHLGFNQFFYQERALQAADTLASAVGLAGTPQYLPRLVARLRSSEGGLQVASGFLQSLIEQTDDEYRKAEYAKALDEIEVERRARFLDEAREIYWRRNGRDIEQVADLLAPPNPVLKKLPRAQLFLDGFEWVLDEETGQIVSSFYRSRYELHVTESDRARQKRWREMREAKKNG